MSEIWKYEIHAGSQFLEIPGLERFLAVGVQEGGPVVWAIVQPDQPKQRVCVSVAVTGGSPQAGNFLGTFQDGWFVGHVFWEPA